MIRFLRPALAAVAGAIVMAAAGCATGAQPIPPIATLEPYNGEWVLEATERPPASMQFLSTDGFLTESMGKLADMMTRSEHMALEVNDSVFRVSSDKPGFSFSLPVDGTPIEVQDEDGEVVQSMTLSWIEGTPVVRRTLPGIGWVSDRYELTADGALVITLSGAARNARGMDVEGSRPAQFVYVRSNSSRS